MMGQYTHNLDQKNRLAMPAKLREALGESFVLCIAPNGENCLFAYSMEAWEGAMQAINNQPPSKELTMRQRIIYRNAETVEPDKQGRITIPPRFMEKARLEREVHIVGAGRRVELWSPAEWDRMLEQSEAMEAQLLTDFPY